MADDLDLGEHGQESPQGFEKGSAVINKEHTTTIHGRFSSKIGVKAGFSKKAVTLAPGIGWVIWPFACASSRSQEKRRDDKPQYTLNAIEKTASRTKCGLVISSKAILESTIRAKSRTYRTSPMRDGAWHLRAVLFMR